MDRLNQIQAQIGQSKIPPVDSWNPDHCGEMDMVIKNNGDWIHDGRKITRNKMVSLFASILKREADDYFLVTPVEKVKITVENTPFIVISADYLENHWYITNNLGEVQQLTAENIFDLKDEQNPQLFWRRNLPARINQNVMYQWQTYALEHAEQIDGNLIITSGSDQFVIGSL